MSEKASDHDHPKEYHLGDHLSPNSCIIRWERKPGVLHHYEVVQGPGIRAKAKAASESGGAAAVAELIGYKRSDIQSQLNTGNGSMAGRSPERREPIWRYVAMTQYGFRDINGDDNSADPKKKYRVQIDGRYYYYSSLSHAQYGECATSSESVPMRRL